MMNGAYLSLFLILIFVCLVFGKRPWHENANFYQVYPRSFKDSDGNGIGDIKGVISELYYLNELGIDGIWLNPILKSPQKDAGYDISDYREIDSLFGSMNDFEELLQAARKANLHIIMDFVPNHVSNKHEWFVKSENNEPGYENYFIWHKGIPNMNGGRPLPPNNWISVMVGSMWEWSEKRQEYYFHQFLPEQVDLNYRNPKVVEEIKDVLRFWLNKGISGFRIDAVPCLFEVAPDTDGNLPDEPPSNECDDPTQHCYYKHIYTQNQSETYDMVHQWRAVLDEYGKDSKVMMIEVLAPPEDLARYHRHGANIPFNFEPLYTWNEHSNAQQIKTFVENYMNYIPKGYYPNWVLGNHDQSRLSTRLGERRADLFTILIQTLPGHAVTYYGEEIGMTDVFISWEDTQDPQACATNSSYYQDRSRDPARTPFQWDESKNGGFSTADKCWLPVGNYKKINFAKQNIELKSRLWMFKHLIALRKIPVFRDGLYEGARDGNIYAYLRSKDGNIFVIVLNFMNSATIVDLTKMFRSIPEKLYIILSLDQEFKPGDVIYSDKLSLLPEAGVILRASNSASMIKTSILTLLLVLMTSYKKLCA